MSRVSEEARVKGGAGGAGHRPHSVGGSGGCCCCMP